MGMRCDVGGYEGMKLSGHLVQAVYDLGLWDTADDVCTIPRNKILDVIWAMARKIDNDRLIVDGGLLLSPMMTELSKLRALVDELYSDRTHDLVFV